MEGNSNNGSDGNNEGTGDDDNDYIELERKAQKVGGDGDSGVRSDMEYVVSLNGRGFNKLVQIGPWQSVQDHIIELMAINTSRDDFPQLYPTQRILRKTDLNN